MRPAAAPHNSVVALPDRGERSGGPADPADVHHGVGLAPLHDPTALAEGRVLDEVAVEVDPGLLSPAVSREDSRGHQVDACFASVRRPSRPSKTATRSSGRVTIRTATAHPFHPSSTAISSASVKGLRIAQ